MGWAAAGSAWESENRPSISSQGLNLYYKMSEPGSGETSANRGHLGVTAAPGVAAGGGRTADSGAEPGNANSVRNSHCHQCHASSSVAYGRIDHPLLVEGRL